MSLIPILFSLITAALASEPNACEKSKLNTFPFLKPWSARLQNFKVPIENGRDGVSNLYAVGARVFKPAQPLTVDQLAKAWTAHSTDLKFESRAGSARSKLGLDLADFVTPEERRLIDQCGPRDCKVKVSPQELSVIAAMAPVGTPDHSVSMASPRVARFKKILQDRVGVFLEAGVVSAYDDLKQIAWTERKLPSALPVEFGTHFFIPQPKSQRAVFGVETVELSPGEHKPVSSIFSRYCQRRGDRQRGAEFEYLACADVVVYNNHYFDFWARQFYFVPWCDGHWLVIGFETADVDQIKISRLVAVLFGSQMRELFSALLEARLKSLDMLAF